MACCGGGVWLDIWMDTLDTGHRVTFSHSHIHHKQPEELWDGYFDIPPPALALAVLHNQIYSLTP